MLRTHGALNPLPWPGNGDHPETPLPRLRPNVGENQTHFMPRVPSQDAMRKQLWLVEHMPKLGDFEPLRGLAKACQNHRPAG